MKILFKKLKELLNTEISFENIKKLFFFICTCVDTTCHRIPIIGRIYHELILFSVLVYVLFIVKDNQVLESNPALQLLCFKSLLVSAGVLHATITRKIVFPYIDFNNEVDIWKKILIISLYIIIIFCYASGG